MGTKAHGQFDVCGKTRVLLSDNFGLVGEGAFEPIGNACARIWMEGMGGGGREKGKGKNK